MNVRRRSDGKKAVEKMSDKAAREKGAELLVLGSWIISTPAIPISAERKKNIVTYEMNLTARQCFPFAIDR